MPETLYLLGKAAMSQGDTPAAQKSWSEVIAQEPRSDLAAQAHFGLATLYRKQGKQAEADREMSEFRKLKNTR
jgi:TolA-binding protein